MKKQPHQHDKHKNTSLTRRNDNGQFDKLSFCTNTQEKIKGILFPVTRSINEL